MNMTHFFTIFFISILIYAAIDTVIDYTNERWWLFNSNRNFPFKWKGKTLWYSRSVAVALFTYCKNNLGEWCVLANKRGDGTPDYQGCWNCSCGYLDWDENAAEAAQRECQEETGIKIPIDKIQFVKVNSEPKSNRQNVTIHHIALLDNNIDVWSNFDLSKMEKNEVSEIKWIPISEINNYNWAFNHDKLIMEYLPK